MTKKINEAQVKIDIAGLESSDIETLSRMLALAGQAEKTASVAPMVPPMAPLDLGGLGGSAEDEVGSGMPGETQPIMNPGDSMSADDSMDMSDPLSSAVDDLSGGATDFGSEAELGAEDALGMGGDESSEFSIDLGGQPQLESSTSDEDEMIEEEFDFGRMFSLAGVSVNEDVNSEIEEDDEESEENEEEVTGNSVNENRILPDLSLEENSPVQDDSNTDFGPFRSEHDAVVDGEMKTNGVQGDNFIVVPKGNQFYWRRVMREEAETTEPDPSTYDNEGNVHRVHEFKPKQPGTALGDNPLNVYEEDEEYEDESVEDIYESLQSKYEKFLGGK